MRRILLITLIVSFAIQALSWDCCIEKVKTLPTPVLLSGAGLLCSATIFCTSTYKKKQINPKLEKQIETVQNTYNQKLDTYCASLQNTITPAFSKNECDFHTLLQLNLALESELKELQHTNLQAYHEKCKEYKQIHEKNIDIFTTHEGDAAKEHVLNNIKLKEQLHAQPLNNPIELLKANAQGKHTLYNYARGASVLGVAICGGVLYRYSK